jgi:branched-chain amino acid transport system ATP-binding protein
MLLEIRELHVEYDSVHALDGVSLEVADGAFVAILGANGAGKSSLLRALMGLERARRGTRVTFAGEDITDWPPSRRVRRGLVLVPEGRRIIVGLTVHENLLMGAFNRDDQASVVAEMADIYARFPNLCERRNQPAGVLSGGEQQMLAIGRGLLAAPRLMMLDEPSLGLSPRLGEEVFALIAELNRRRGLTILLIEQNTRQALALATHAYVLELGRIVAAGAPKDLGTSVFADAYLVQGNRAHAEAEIE